MPDAKREKPRRLVKGIIVEPEMEKKKKKKEKRAHFASTQLQKDIVSAQQGFPLCYQERLNFQAFAWRDI